jgi:hypothetical protein
MKKSTFAIRYVPGMVSETTGVTAVPCPMAGIHGTTTRVSPEAGAPVVADEIAYSTLCSPRVGGCGDVRTAI